MSDLYTKREILRGEEVDVIYCPSKRPIDPKDLDPAKMGQAKRGVCPPLNPRTYIAEPGIICQQDVAVTLRDGTVIYADIYRPEGEEKVPLIVAWGFYGKRPNEGGGEWQIMGVVPGTVSKMAKFEGPDPAYWCKIGYAVANVDARGTGYSEGDVNFFGTQDGRDGYDFIEWAAQQDWCTGKVGMAGNSALAMAQWRIAAEQPPHLSCFAPWEGTSDIYRESIYEGGIPALTFNQFILRAVTGLSGMDDMISMAKQNPLMNAYWQDKIPEFKNIRVPCYVTSCWNHFHNRGSFEGFRRIKSSKKWIRAHQEYEWPDGYSSEQLEDLRRFFDRYLKDIRNGWEMTPKVRIDVQDAYEYPYQKARAEKEFPLARTQYKKLYLNAADGSLGEECPEQCCHVSYDANTGVSTFDIRFDKDTEITGYMKLHLWVEAQGHDDMDMFVNIQKLNTKGEFVPVMVLGEPHPGTWGKMRVSHRALDEKKSKHYQPIQSHLKEEKLSPGEIVPVDIEIVPSSRFWHKGQSLRVEIAGRYIRDEGWFEPLTWETDNHGMHVIHTGGQYDSYLQIPEIPPKYEDGDIQIR